MSTAVAADVEVGEVGRAALDAMSRIEPASRLGRAQVSRGEKSLPVLAGLSDLLPGGALRRGSVLTVQGSGSLLLALLALASAQGSWCVEVGSPLIGSAAAAEVGVALDRFVRVPAPGERWPEVVASLLDGFDVVVVHPPRRRTARDDQAIRRLSARTRERGAVLVATGPWEGAGLGLTVTAERWYGLGRGHGHLSARQVVVSAVGRGSAVRPRRARLWLPGPDGRVGVYEESPVDDDRHARVLDLPERTRACAGSSGSSSRPASSAGSHHSDGLPRMVGSARWVG